MNKLISAERLAAIVGVGTQTVWRWSRENRVPCYRVGRTLRFDLNEVLQTLKRSTLK